MLIRIGSLRVDASIWVPEAIGTGNTQDIPTMGDDSRCYRYRESSLVVVHNLL